MSGLRVTGGGPWVPEEAPPLTFRAHSPTVSLAHTWETGAQHATVPAHVHVHVYYTRQASHSRDCTLPADRCPCAGSAHVPCTHDTPVRIFPGGWGRNALSSEAFSILVLQLPVDLGLRGAEGGAQGPCIRPELGGLAPRCCSACSPRGLAASVWAGAVPRTPCRYFTSHGGAASSPLCEGSAGPPCPV